MLQESLKQPQPRELTPDETMEILTRNYTEKDPEALKLLCLEYERRGADLEKYLETNFKDIPTREEAEQKRSLEAKKAILNFKHNGVVIKDSRGYLVDLRVKYTRPFHKWLASKVTRAKGMFVNRDKTAVQKDDMFVFWYKGARIKEDDTPLSLKMHPYPSASSEAIEQDYIEVETVFEVRFLYLFAMFNKSLPSQVTKVLPKREFDEKDPLADDFRKAEAQFLKMQAEGFHMNLSIESVDVVKNRYLQELFEDKRQDLKKSEGSDVKSLLLFHGTPQENIASILRDNFNLAKKVNGRKYGDGVYFSEQPEVSVGYTNTGFDIAGK